MSGGPVVVHLFTADIEALIAALADTGLARLMVDEGGVKVAPSGRSWTPPLGMVL